MKTTFFLPFLTVLVLLGQNRLLAQLSEDAYPSPADTMVDYYFREIAYGGDLSGFRERCRYRKDVYIYAYGQLTNPISEELNRIVEELNELIDPIQLYITDKQEEATIKIFLGNADQFRVINPRSAKYLDGNYGLFEYHLSDNNEIDYSLVFVDVVRTSSEEGIKHLLREELTQSLGLGNDSFRFPESIFYQGWTTTTSYAEIDKKIIQKLYNGIE